MEEKKIIRCFIASPGDTEEERDICENVFSEINAGIGTAYGFVLQYFLKLMQGLEQLMDLFFNLFDGRMMSIPD